jgi:maltose alpha-D-glucosyltransferase/alpha-amylase
MRSMLQIRREHPAFGMGAYVAVEADNPAVLAFLRVLRPDPDDDDLTAETILCVTNLSPRPQAARLRMPDWASAELSDVFGGSGFEPVPADGQLSLTMGSRDFFWLTVSGGPTGNPPG